MKEEKGGKKRDLAGLNPHSHKSYTKKKESGEKKKESVGLNPHIHISCTWDMVYTAKL